MFRRLSSSLPKDPEFPADLEKLGYFINDQDQIRSIDDPTAEFHYFISKNERVLEMQREAMDTCIRTNLTPRFHAIGLQTTRLPTSAGPDDPHIPILTTANLATAKRIIIYFGETDQDLGIFAYRIVGKDSLASGSCLNFAFAAMKQGVDIAVVIANLGQNLWNRRSNRAITMRSWLALPRKTGVSPGTKIGKENKVPGHESKEAHVESIFAFVGKQMAKEAKVEVVGICEGIETGMGFLNENWEEWKAKIGAIVIGLGYVWHFSDVVSNADLRAFMAKRARAYLIHDEPPDTLLSGRKRMGCDVVSSGEAQYTECIMPKAYTAMLAFLQLLIEAPGYAKPFMLNGDDDDDDDDDDDNYDEGPSRGTVEWVKGDVEKSGGGVTFSMPIRERPQDGGT